MLSRLYIVKMPNETPTTALDILVQSAPGSVDAPETSGGDGHYYEYRGRELRLETIASDGVANGFVPRLRLGFEVSITRYGASIVTDLPAVQLSASLVPDLSTTDSGPTILVTPLADPAGEPAIRLVGGTGTAGLIFLVSLQAPDGTEDDAPQEG